MTRQKRFAFGAHEDPRREGFSKDWLSPPSMVDLLGPFDLDPCASLRQPWRTARTQFTEEDDGLAQPWHGTVWLNPPYGNRIVEWVRRLSDHGLGILLVHARIETTWFHRHVWYQASAIHVPRGRINFHMPGGKRCRRPAAVPSILVAFGWTMANRLCRITSHPRFGGRTIWLK